MDFLKKKFADAKDVIGHGSVRASAFTSTFVKGSVMGSLGYIGDIKDPELADLVKTMTEIETGLKSLASQTVEFEKTVTSFCDSTCKFSEVVCVFFSFFLPSFLHTLTIIGDEISGKNGFVQSGSVKVQASSERSDVEGFASQCNQYDQVVSSGDTNRYQ